MSGRSVTDGTAVRAAAMSLWPDFGYTPSDNEGAPACWRIHEPGGHMRATLTPIFVFAIALSFPVCAVCQAQKPPQQPQFGSFERERALQMLETISSDVKKHYYDPKFHGVDWDARVKEAKEKIQASTSQNAALSHIAGALDALHDSHTFFLPPSRPFVDDYGVEFEMIGERCFVVRVRPGSDAEAKGVKAGDEVSAINGFAPTRQDLWQIDYVFHTLRPQLSLRLDLREPGGQPRQVEAMAKFRELRQIKDLSGGGGGSDIWDLFRAQENANRLNAARYQELGDDLMILKLPIFAFSEPEIEDLIIRARKHKALIVDLRENGGGSVDTLKYLLEGVFENNLKIADRVGRKDTKPLIDKFRPHNPFGGKLVVLVDSKSASASEIFARVVQLEKRGTIIGDTSSGKVMESRRYSYSAGMGITVFYGASITEADVIMSDGKSLENVGVTPDETVLPPATDLASGRDPALARAAEMLGVKMTPQDAGKLFPYEWPKEE
jgi:C-terminal processing protease CtpA/Prc